MSASKCLRSYEAFPLQRRQRAWKRLLVAEHNPYCVVLRHDWEPERSGVERQLAEHVFAVAELKRVEGKLLRRAPNWRDLNSKPSAIIVSDRCVAQLQSAVVTSCRRVTRFVVDRAQVELKIVVDSDKEARLVRSVKRLS